MPQMLQAADKVWVNPAQIVIVWYGDHADKTQLTYTTPDGRTWRVEKKFKKGFLRCVRLVSQK